MARPKMITDNEVILTEAISPVPTIEQIVGGKRSSAYVMLVQTLQGFSEGKLEALGIGYDVPKDDNQSWKQRIDAIAEAQLVSQGISSYELDSGANLAYANVAPLATEATPQRWPADIRTDSRGDKIRTRLYGAGLAV